jgi:hypothetical protein
MARCSYSLLPSFQTTLKPEANAYYRIRVWQSREHISFTLYRVACRLELACVGSARAPRVDARASRGWHGQKLRLACPGVCSEASMYTRKPQEAT